MPTHAADTSAPTSRSVAPDAAGLAAQLRLAVMRLRRRLTNERHPDNDLSLGAMSVLVALFPDRDLPLGELAARERVQPPSMTRTVNCLEEAGFVLRRSGENDRRQVMVTLTDEGRDRVRIDRDRRDAWLARQLDGLGEDEIAVLRRAAPILERLATG